jgi:diaminopimelate epimerase
MCGNGIRVFAHYLYQTKRVSGESVAIGTRAGLLTVTKDGDTYHVDMGKAHLLSEHVVINANNLTWDGIGVAMPNPHAIATVNDVSEAGALSESPQVTPAAIYPHGVNVEFIANVGPNHIAMRVFERGVGETFSCGTGVCAAAYAARRQASQTGHTKWRVDVPGGTLFVQQDDDDSMVLSGPAVIVATGTLNETLWQ